MINVFEVVFVYGRSLYFVYLFFLLYMGNYWVEINIGSFWLLVDFFIIDILGDILFLKFLLEKNMFIVDNNICKDLVY